MALVTGDCSSPAFLLVTSAHVIEISIVLSCRFGQLQYWLLPACDRDLPVSMYIRSMYM